MIRENKMKTEKIILTGLMMALTTVATMVIQIPTPFTSGYINLGDSMVFLSVMVLGWKYGAIAGGIGAGLADLISGYTMYVPWTIGIKAGMAVLMGLVIEACMNNKKNMIPASIATCGLWIGFNVVINTLVRHQAGISPESLLTDEVTSVSQLGVFLDGMQSKLMLAALLIPVFLLLVSFYIKKKEHMVIPMYEILAMTMAGLWMVFGYYIAGGVIYGNFAVSAFSVPMNMIQFILGFTLAAMLAAALERTPAVRFFTYKRKMKTAAAM